MGNRWDGTTPTDTRSQRSRTSRRGGQLLTRARSPPNKNGLPIHVPRRPLFRTVTPYARLGTPSQQNNTRTLAVFHTGYQQHRVAELPAAEDHQEPRPLPQRRRGDQTALASDLQHRGQAGPATAPRKPACAAAPNAKPKGTWSKAKPPPAGNKPSPNSPSSIPTESTPTYDRSQLPYTKDVDKLWRSRGTVQRGLLDLS